MRNLDIRNHRFCPSPLGLLLDGEGVVSSSVRCLLRHSIGLVWNDVLGLVIIMNVNVIQAAIQLMDQGEARCPHICNTDMVQKVIECLSNSKRN